MSLYMELKWCLFWLPHSADSYWKPLDLLHQHITQNWQMRLQNVGLITKAEWERLKNVNVHHWSSTTYWAPTDENLLRELRQARTRSVRGIKVHQSALLYPVLLIMFSHAHSNNSAFDFNCLAGWMAISVYQALTLFKLTTEVSGTHGRHPLIPQQYGLQPLNIYHDIFTFLIPKTMLWDHRHMVGSLFNLYREMKEQTLLMHRHSLCLATGTSTMFLL